MQLDGMSGASNVEHLVTCMKLKEQFNSNEIFQVFDTFKFFDKFSKCFQICVQLFDKGCKISKYITIFVCSVII